MSWHEQLICRILLLVARIVTEDESLNEELRRLSTYIQVRREA